MTDDKGNGCQGMRGALPGVENWTGAFARLVGGSACAPPWPNCPGSRRRHWSAQAQQPSGPAAIHEVPRRLPVEGAVSAPQLQQAFCITGAEASVMLALMDGVLPKSYAASRKVSINTVRSQINSLLSKMGCQRQIDLVRIGLYFAWDAQVAAVASPHRAAGADAPIINLHDASGLPGPNTHAS